MAGVSDEADAVELVATIAARVMQPMSDRAAILYRAGFDEATWQMIERGVLLRLEVERTQGRSDLAVRFARAFATCRVALSAEDAPAPADYAAEEVDPEELMSTLASRIQRPPESSTPIDPSTVGGRTPLPKSR